MLLFNKPVKIKLENLLYIGISYKVLLLYHFVFHAGPKRSTLQAMLANLGQDEEIPALQSGNTSPPRGDNNNGDRDVDESGV